MPARARTYNKPHREARLKEIKLIAIEVAKAQQSREVVKARAKCGVDLLYDAIIDLGFDTWTEMKEHYK